MSVVETIAKKRDGGEIGPGELGRLVSGFVRGDIGEGPMAAFLMAVFLQGMTPGETAALTQAMVESGERIDLTGIPGRTVDKHSTGGVGDKTTLVVAPLAAALGVPVPKMSGRALGHTGGTIDKLKSIPGIVTDLSPDRFRRQVAEIGVAIASATPDMVPADKKMYALRDATGTVESIPLIASSVMSKKLAVGAEGIVLDVKVGGGAFMREVERAEELARTMVEIGRQSGKRVVALVTRMEEPIGSAVGDALEMAEAVATLRGEGPADFVALCEVVAGYMLFVGGAASSGEEGMALAGRGLERGVGMDKLREMVAAQGGDTGVLDDPRLLVKGARRTPVTLEAEGYVTGVEARSVGLAVRNLKQGAGSRSACGVEFHKKVGDLVSAGEEVATVVAPEGLGAVVARTALAVGSAFTLGRKAGAQEPLLARVVHPQAGS